MMTKWSSSGFYLLVSSSLVLFIVGQIELVTRIAREKVGRTVSRVVAEG